MALADRDPHTGHMLTGHEWNGITELNTPVPKAVYVFLIAAALFSLGYWILMPAWPLGVTFTKGLLGTDQRAVVAESLQQAATDRSAWTTRIASEDFSRIQADQRLMQVVRQSGRTLFGENCAACHGREAKGGKGFPNLTTGAWLWGGNPEQIAQTIRVGINSTHRETRNAQMPAFGRDGMLPRDDVLNVVDYVLSLSAAPSPGVSADRIAAGKAVFVQNCVPCHGESGKGNKEVGGPDLTDRFAIYGRDPQSVYSSVWGGRQGHMPAWEPRLSAVERKILTLYLVDLRKPGQ